MGANSYVTLLLHDVQWFIHIGKVFLYIFGGLECVGHSCYWEMSEFETRELPWQAGALATYSHPSPHMGKVVPDLGFF